ncbi:unnamed protein product, partial [marine sediment metagenome]
VQILKINLVFTSFDTSKFKGISSKKKANLL